MAPWAVAIGFLTLALPTAWDFVFGRWAAYSQGHEPLVLGAAAYLAWMRRDAWGALPERARSTAVPYTLFCIGLPLYLFGRTQQFLRLELLSLIVVAAGLVAHRKGVGALKVMAVPFLALLFVMPLPYAWVMTLTGPLKSAVSAVTAAGLFELGYPVARNGVVITVGQYQLLVAEACAGLQTMFALEAFGLFYTQLMGYRSWQRTLLLALAVVPVGFVANVVRTAILVVVTYHFGDDVGQGFVHGFAGLLLFAVAIAMLHAIDRSFDLLLPQAWKR